MESVDLGKLPCISEESIVACLKSRLLSNIIYTWAGSNLVAVNPFQDVMAFDDQQLEELMQSSEVSGLPPHVYAIAQTAHRGLLDGADQTVIISGESGAGKTFSAHRLLHYLVRLEESRHDCSTGTGAAMEHKLNVSNPLLEAFGNARTTNNENSSRFCKLFRLAYGVDGRLRGGAIHSCLFEKTRVTWQSAGERSFHVFYQLLAGMPAASLKTLGLERTSALDALSGRPSAADKADFAVTESAMAELGLSGAQRASVFAVLAALLHLSQLTVVRRDGRFYVDVDARLVCACRLLGLSAPVLAEALTVQQLTAGRHSVVRRPCSSEAEVLTRRDCLVREIYDRLFRWLVEWINVEIAPTGATPRALSLLDISGFESLENNSLEQLSINYANERLQQFFLTTFLRRLEAAFLEEGLIGARLDYPDNAAALVALDGPMPSVFGGVEEASGLRQAVSAADLSTAVQRAACAAAGTGPAAGAHTFVVRHFCGSVVYDARRLVEKNRDRVDPDLVALLSDSSSALVRALPPPPALVGTPSGARRRHTVLARLQLTMRELLRRLAGTDVQYVRCVRPNGAGSRRLVVDGYLRRQLRAAGVVATARLSAAGFPFRLTADEFVERFAILVRRGTREKQDPRLVVEQTMTSWLPGDPEVRLGTGQVFLTQRAWHRLGGLCQLRRHAAARRLQNSWRRRRRLRAAVLIQRGVRAWLSRRRLAERRHSAACLLQCHVRAWLGRRRLAERRHSAACLLQRHVRAWLGRRRLTERRHSAARLLQRHARRWLSDRRRNRAAEVVQRRVRAWLVDCRRHRAAALIQCRMRAWLAVRRRHRAAAIVQRAYRRHRHLRRLRARHVTLRQRRPRDVTTWERRSASDLSDGDSGVSCRSSPSDEARRWSARSAAGELSAVSEGDARSTLHDGLDRLDAGWKRRSLTGPRSLEQLSAFASRLFADRGVVSLRYVFDVPLRFHTRKTCLPLSNVLPRHLVPGGLLDIL